MNKHFQLFLRGRKTFIVILLKGAKFLYAISSNSLQFTLFRFWYFFSISQNFLVVNHLTEYEKNTSSWIYACTTKKIQVGFLKNAIWQFETRAPETTILKERLIPWSVSQGADFCPAFPAKTARRHRGDPLIHSHRLVPWPSSQTELNPDQNKWNQTLHFLLSYNSFFNNRIIS